MQTGETTLGSHNLRLANGGDVVPLSQLVDAALNRKVTHSGGSVVTDGNEGVNLSEAISIDRFLRGAPEVTHGAPEVTAPEVTLGAPEVTRQLKKLLDAPRTLVSSRALPTLRKLHYDSTLFESRNFEIFAAKYMRFGQGHHLQPQIRPELAEVKRQLSVLSAVIKDKRTTPSNRALALSRRALLNGYMSATPMKNGFQYAIDPPNERAKLHVGAFGTDAVRDVRAMIELLENFKAIEYFQVREGDLEDGATTLEYVYAEEKPVKAEKVLAKIVFDKSSLVRNAGLALALRGWVTKEDLNLLLNLQRLITRKAGTDAANAFREQLRGITLVPPRAQQWHVDSIWKQYGAARSLGEDAAYVFHQGIIVNQLVRVIITDVEDQKLRENSMVDALRNSIGDKSTLVLLAQAVLQMKGRNASFLGEEAKKMLLELFNDRIFLLDPGLRKVLAPEVTTPVPSA